MSAQQEAKGAPKAIRRIEEAPTLTGEFRLFPLCQDLSMPLGMRSFAMRWLTY